MGFMGKPATIPAIRTERCIVYCMNCGRSTSAATYVVEGLFGWLPYGRVTNRLHCRKGCGDRYGMVLPIDAPTPRQFAERYHLEPAPTRERQAFADIESEMRDRLVEIGEGDTFVKVHAKSEDAAIMHWGFEYLLKKFSQSWSKPPRLAVVRGAQWSRDSLRDYKVVGGTVVEIENPVEPEDEDDDAEI
jgi:hypothetical protein